MSDAYGAPREVPADTRFADGGNWNLASRLEAVAARTPSKVALRSDGGDLTFADLDGKSGAVAGGLFRLGVRAGDRVAIMGGSHWETIATAYGSWKLGAIVVSVNTQLGPEEVHQQLANCEPTVVVVDPGRPRSVVEHAVSGLDRAPLVVTMGEFEDPPLSAVQLGPDAYATISYTSGTTGVPKGATHTHRAHRVLLEMNATRFTLSEGDVMLSVLPICSLSVFLLGPLLSIHVGATCRLMARYDAFDFACRIKEDRTTVIGATVPMIFSDLYALPPEKAAEVDLSSIRIASCGGSPMPTEIRRAFEERFDFRFLHAYGGTEGPAIVSTDPLDRERKFDSVGVPLPHIDLTIESDDGATLPPGEIGEICTAPHREGPFADLYEPMRAYWGMPAETAEALRGGRLHWGDLGYLDEDGFVHLVDRKKDVIFRGGMNVYPKELEILLYADKRIAECAVVGAEHARYGEVPWAFVRVAPSVEISEEEVCALVSEHAARFKHLEGVSFVEDFPRNALGKILKRELRLLTPEVEN